MLSPEQVAEFDQNGFVLGGRVLDDGAVEELRGEMERVIRDHDKPGVPQPVLLSNIGPDDRHAIWQIVNIYEASAPFRRLIEHPAIVGEIAQLTRARELRIWHDQIQYKPAATGGVNQWHQDSPYWPVLQPKHEQVSAWVALDDVDEANGCMSMIPGSHQWGDQIDYLHEHLRDYHHPPREFEGRALRVVRRPVQRGHVHYHHALTWHGSQENTSGRPRRAIALHYITERTCYDASGDHVMKQFVDVDDGAPLQGEHFPLVWSAESSPATSS